MTEASEAYARARAASDHREAIRLAETALERARLEGNPRLAALSHLELGMRRVLLGEVDDARASLLEALSGLEAAGAPLELGVCLYQLSVVVESPARQRSSLRRALPLLEAGGESVLAGDCCAALARLAADPGAADRLYARAAAHYGTAAPMRTARVLGLRARLASDEGDLQRAEARLLEALETIRSVRMSRSARNSEAELLEALGDCRSALGQRDAAESYRDALRIFDWLELTRSARRVADKLEPRPRGSA